ncbi:hypothetical protein L6164_029143 [Bauhinia variegata]|uniref:Uncharacterized protein n=1 Tax=Bauhinia variegata TaxID=167791 RepID=A0ACB9L7S8_BAUVA|nr:hypothetical protein L6164_029143 [Bauhinia variegata]
MAQSSANRVYEDFEPASEWAHDEGSDTLILMLPGFKKGQLKVRITSNGILMIHGERQVGENKWLRFSKEFKVPSDCDTNDIGAKFTVGLLYVKLHKLITPAEPEETTEPPQEVPKPSAQSQDQQKATEEVSSQPRKDKEEEKVKETSQEEKKPRDDAKEMGKIEADANKETQKKEKRTNGAPPGLGKSVTMLLSRQTQEYKEALAGWIGRLDKQNKMANVIVAILIVLVLGLYVKNAVKSFHGRSKIQEL